MILLSALFFIFYAVKCRVEYIFLSSMMYFSCIYNIDFFIFIIKIMEQNSWKTEIQ